MYLKKYSGVTALIDIYDTLLRNMDRDDINGLLILDLSKAFDLINHNHSISCWKNFRICESAVGKLFETHFIMDRKPWNSFECCKTGIYDYLH